MRFGIQISQGVGLKPTGRDYISLAQYAEALGFHSVWIGDHIVIPKRITAAYPYTKDGSLGFPPETPYLDSLAVLAVIGATTTKIKIGTGILVVPYRNPIDVAKSVITADLMSNGRLLLGVGVGWLREEFEALGIPFSERGLRTDESLQIMKAMWTGNLPFKGKLFSVPEVHVYPPPVQTPHPPIIIGGQGMPAFRRIVSFGDGWYSGPIASNELRPLLDQLDAMLVERGRALSDIKILMSASPQFICEQESEITRLEKAGVEEFIVLLRDSAPEHSRATMDKVARAVFG